VDDCNIERLIFVIRSWKLTQRNWVSESTAIDLLSIHAFGDPYAVSPSAFSVIAVFVCLALDLETCCVFLFFRTMYLCYSQNALWLFSSTKLKTFVRNALRFLCRVTEIFNII
jgi:hypothetical protein